jgi:hypothetical protein
VYSVFSGVFIIHLHVNIVAYRSVAKKWHCKPQSLQGNAHTLQWRRCHDTWRAQPLQCSARSICVRGEVTTTIEEMVQAVFSVDPLRGYMTRPTLFCLATKQDSPHKWQISKAHTGSRITHGFQHPVRVWLYNKIMQETSRSHRKSWKWKFSRHWTRRSLTQEI